MELTAVKSDFRGRKKQIGNLIRLQDGRLGTFVGYCPNNSCRDKICMDMEEAKRFTEKFSNNKKKLVNRMLLGLLERLEVASR